MKLILTGASGMVGTGVLREALADASVESVLCIGRRSLGMVHPKLQEHLMPDLFQVNEAASAVRGYDACIWAVGVSSVGQTEAEYARVTEELTLLWARALLAENPAFSFCYCSARGAEGSSMWARVRTRLETELQKLPFKHVGCVRPGFIMPGPGIRSNTALYQAFLTLGRPLLPLLARAFPQVSTTSERLGRAMLRVVQGRSDVRILESDDINRVGA